MHLSDFVLGRDNNFNLIRILAALAVLLSHSFVLTGFPEPLSASIGMTPGSIAVDIFFITSGFLVTGSLLDKKNIIDFVWSRIMRIYPALLVMLLITVFGIGMYFTSLSAQAYLSSTQTHLYFSKCLTLFSGVVFELPGVFVDNPFKGAVNSSLWTMPKELKLYAILGATWVALCFFKSWRVRLFESILVAAAVMAGCLLLGWSASGIAISDNHRLFFMFFSGAAFYVLRGHIRLSGRVFFGSMLALLGSAFFYRTAFYSVYIFTIGYLLFYVAYIPSGIVRRYNRLGDYSYGVYIYAFPVQQSVAALMPEVTPLPMMAISGAVTLLLSVLSWHFIEKRALSIKGALIGQTKKMLAYKPVWVG